MKNLPLSTLTPGHSFRRNLARFRQVDSSVLGVLATFLLISGAAACGDSSTNKNKDAAAGGLDGGAGQGGVGGEGQGGGGGQAQGGAAGEGQGGLGGDGSGIGGAAGGAGGGAGSAPVGGIGGSGVGGVGGVGTGGTAATGGAGGSGTGGAVAITCGNHVPVAHTVFTDFEYLETSPTLSFTTADGFDGKFFGDDSMNSMGFAVTADAHGGTHALTVSSTNTGFVEIGLDFNMASGCLDLSAFTGISFWAKGAGTIGLKVTDGSGDYSFTAPLTGAYAQYTATWAQLGMFSPPVITKTRNLLLTVDGPTTTSPASLFLDDISFVP